MANEVRIRITAKDDVSSVIEKIQLKASTLSKTDIGKGMAMGAGIAAFGVMKDVASKALDAVVDFATGSVAAAVEEEQGIARLDASLRANVAGWDGNTAAIERSTSAGLDKGFADEAVRDSLARLLPITKDVGQAQIVQAAAMDLARYKGISLVDASLAIGKAMQGNKRMLKELGISLSDAGTGFQTLGEIQRVVAGQADAYAKSTAGQMESLNVHIGDLQDQLGAKLLPAVRDATTGALGLLKALDDSASSAERGRGLRDFIEQYGRLTPLTAGYAEALRQETARQDTAANVMRQGREAAARMSAEMNGVSEATRWVGAWVDKAIPGVGALGDSLGKSGGYAHDAAAALRDLKSSVNDLLGSMSDQERMLELPGLIAATEKDLAKAIKDGTAGEVAAVQAKLAQLKVEFHGMTTYLSGEGLSAGKSYMTGLVRGLAGVKLANGAVVKAGVAVNVDLLPGHAAGGFIPPYGSSLVGERGPEVVRTGSSGASVNPSAASAGGGGGSVVIKLVVDGREMASVVDRHLYYRAARAPRSPYAS